MRKSILTPMLVCLVAVICACGSNNDDSPVGLPPDNGDLLAMAGCTAEGLKHLGFAVKTSVILFHELENYPPYTPPFEFHYRENDGTFDYIMALGSVPTDRTVIEGVVAPLSVVADGLQQHDNFTITWTMRLQDTTPIVASGSFRVIHNGLTTPPNQTETLRVIPADTISCGTEGACYTEFTQFELTVHHLLEVEEVRSAMTSFRCTGAAPDTLVGYMTTGAGSDVGNITGTYNGATYSCTINLETYAIECAEN